MGLPLVVATGPGLGGSSRRSEQLIQARTLDRACSFRDLSLILHPRLFELRLRLTRDLVGVFSTGPDDPPSSIKPTATASHASSHNASSARMVNLVELRTSRPGPGDATVDDYGHDRRIRR